MTAIFNGNLLLTNSLLKASTYAVDSIVYIYPIVYSLLNAYTAYSAQFIVYINTIVYSLLNAYTSHIAQFTLYIHHSAQFTQSSYFLSSPPQPQRRRHQDAPAPPLSPLPHPGHRRRRGGRWDGPRSWSRRGKSGPRRGDRARGAGGRR